MRILQKLDFAGAFGDLRAFFGTLGKRHYVAAVASVVVAAFIVWGFYRESYFELEPQITYVENWPANRTDAEIQADQRRDSAEKHREQAARQAEFQKIQKFNDRIGL
jgi:hypothetical protein